MSTSLVVIGTHGRLIPNKHTGFPELISFDGVTKDKLTVFQMAPPGKCGQTVEKMLEITLNELIDVGVDINNFLAIDNYLAEKYIKTNPERQGQIFMIENRLIRNHVFKREGFEFLIAPLKSDDGLDIYFDKLFETDRTNYSIMVQESPDMPLYNILNLEELVNYVKYKRKLSSSTEAIELIETVIPKEDLNRVIKDYGNNMFIITEITFTQLYSLLKNVLRLENVYTLDNTCLIFVGDLRASRLINRSFNESGFDIVKIWLAKNKASALAHDLGSSSSSKGGFPGGGFRGKRSKKRVYKKKNKRTKGRRKGKKYAL
jgi:hypothetical protein